MKIHEIMAENRVRFAQRLNEMSEELATLAKEVDKNRKQVGGTLVNDAIADCRARRKSWQHDMSAPCKTPKAQWRSAKIGLIQRRKSSSVY